MMKKLYSFAIAAVLCLICSFGAGATGWPANYQGVMLQGFYWDSYNDTRWSTLASKADEYSKYFTLIWVPNSAKPASSPSMGYDPVYWFTNHTSSFGNESQLRAMIRIYKEKGVGIIEDVVVNHRSGVSNWYNFPSETWNGKTWLLSNGSICSTDEVWADGGHGCPASYKGNPDTGEDFGSSRDLDHTNLTVQDNVKNYCKFLIDDLGYAGFRLDMVKGYGGQYTKIYNQYSKPQFCVGECFDGSYDVCAAWIEATGRESASFDFPLKFQLNKAFPSPGSYNLTELCWTNPSGAQQPAGLIHYGYPQFAVTFVDNHDTYRDHNKFNGNVLAANAFILCSPGTPCVFLKHYQDYTSQIQALINVRNEVGVHNLSAVRVLKCTSDCYMAEVTGTKGKLVVRIGSTSDTPQGYTSSNIKCSGTGYCVWATTSGGVDPKPDPDPFKVYFRNTVNWTTPYIHYWGSTESTWPGVAMSKVSGTADVWSYTVPAGTTGLLFNAGDGDPTKTADFVAQPNHIYTTSGDQGLYNGGGNNDDPGNYPASLYLLGHTLGYEWATDRGIEAKGNKGVYDWKGVTIDDAGEGSGYFAFATLLGPDWDTVNSSDRYGAPAADHPIEAGQTSSILLYTANVNASGSQSWKIAKGAYDITADLSRMQLSVKAADAAVDDIEFDENLPVEYYNLQGVRVENPVRGIYIRVQGGKAVKIVK